MTIEEENKILKEVFSNLWQNYQYQSEYIQFLLGSYTEEEFVQYAQLIAAPFDKKPHNDYINKIREVMGNEIDYLDVAMLLNFDPTESNYE